MRCLVLDGVKRCGANGAPTFIEAAASTDGELHAPLQTFIARFMNMHTRRGMLAEEMGQTWLPEPNTDGEESPTVRPLQAPAITYRIAFLPHAGQKVLTLRGAIPREGWTRQPLCADIDGFSIHVAVRFELCDCKRLEQLCRYIIPPEALRRAGAAQRDRAGGAQLKTPWRDGTTHLVASPLEFMRRLAVYSRSSRVFH